MHFSYIPGEAANTVVAFAVVLDGLTAEHFAQYFKATSLIFYYFFDFETVFERSHGEILTLELALIQMTSLGLPCISRQPNALVS